MGYPGTHRHIDSPAAVGQRVRALRNQRGLSLAELADMGSTRWFLARIEKGERAPTDTLIRELAVRLGTTPEFIAWGRCGASVDLSVETLLAGLAVESLQELRRLVGVARSYEKGAVPR